MSEEKNVGVISVLKAMDVLRRYKWLLLGLPTISAFIAVGWVSLYVQPTWEAVATIEVGHVGGMGPSIDVLHSGQAVGMGQTSIEPVVNVIARIMHPSFANEAFAFVGSIKPDTLSKARADMGSIKAAKFKDTEMIEVKLRAHSMELAKALMQGSIAALINKHNEMMNAYIWRYQEQLRNLYKDIEVSNREIILLRKKLLIHNEWNAYDATLSATVLQNKTNELRDLIQTKLILEDLLNPAHTYATRIFGEISVPEQPVSPNKRQIIGMAILMGLLVAALVAVVHDLFSKHRLD